jgi:hypothetical protein
MLLARARAVLRMPPQPASGWRHACAFFELRANIQQIAQRGHGRQRNAEIGGPTVALNF